MKLRIIAPGHRMPAWINAGCDEYARRMPRSCPLEIVEVKAEPRAGGKPRARVLAAEASRIAAACRGAQIVALDERGQAWTTRMLADALARWRDDGHDVAFVIGSADGLAEEVKRGAAAVVAVSALTLPHGLVRILIAEQLYRAVSLLGGHPYHRE